MSRTDEVHRITENVYKSIMEQFNPCLRNFVAMGKSYEKALTREVLFQMAEVHRRIQVQLEEMLKSFHNELLTELEKKVQMDARYLNAALKKYRTEHKSKGESLEKCQNELKKLRRKSQSGKTLDRHGERQTQMAAMTEPGAKTLPGPPQPAALRSSGGPQRLTGVGAAAGDGGERYRRRPESKAAAVPRGEASYSNTLPVRKAAPAKSRTSLASPGTLPRSSSMAAGLERNGRGGGSARVQALFSHAAGDNGTLLSFKQGDLVTLLVPEARDGWHYGENEETRMRGWFPFSYTRVIAEADGDSAGRLPPHTLHPGKSSSTGNLLDRDDAAAAAANYRSLARARQAHSYAVAVPAGFSQGAVEEYDPARFTSSASEVKLISTV